MQNKLTGIPETLLIPLWARAFETERTDAIIRDYKAVEMVSKIDYDFAKFKRSCLSQVGVSVRTMLLDKASHDFFRKHPDAVIINLGAGLDTRCERLRDSDFYCWYDLDVPESIALRKKFVPEGNKNKIIAKSMFDYTWMDDVKTGNLPVLIIAEGLFMYFPENEIKNLLIQIIDRFPDAEVLFEKLGPFLVGKAQKHDSLKTIEAAPEFKWGLARGKEIEKFDNRIEFIEEWEFFNYYKKRWGLFGYIARLPLLRRKLSSSIVHVKFRR